jgi:CDP-glucose 4,6-dehydratase
MENLEINNQYSNVYKGKKVIVTGNTGFKGAWLTTWLLELGATVVGISNEIPTSPYSLFEELALDKQINYIQEDIRNGEAIKQIFLAQSPDFVFHLAAQPIVIKSYTDPVDTMTTNIIGTVNILEALRSLQNECVAVMITSDKCYDNVEWMWGYKETDRLGGKDPYSASKGAAELMIKTYYHSYFSKPDSKIKLTAVRAGNVIGGGDWADRRIVPDCINAWINNEVVEIRSPQSTRPWQHVLEPLSGYLLAGKCLYENSSLNGEAFNFGPNSDQNKTVLELIDALAQVWGNTQNDNLYKVIPPPTFHEAGLLKLNCDKALHLLSWKPVMNFKETTSLTTLWYKKFATNRVEMYSYTVNQIKQYASLANNRGLIWTIH